MKILHIVPSYLPAHRYGGPIQSVHNLNKWLVKNGAEVTVYTTSVNGKDDLNIPTGESVDLDGVKVIYFKTGVLRGWFYSAAMRKALVKNINNFDLIHITSVFLSASALGAYYARKFNKPYIISPRGSLMAIPLSISAFKKKTYINFLEKRNLENASAIHFTSEEEKKDYSDAGLKLKKAIVLPNGIDMPEEGLVSDGEIMKFKARYNIPTEYKVISCLGRVSRIKGFDVLIPAIHHLKIEGFKIALLIIGGDDDRGYLKEAEQMVKDMHLEKEVVFAGMLSGKEKGIALLSSDFLAQVSDSESFGMAAAEAMSHGLPVLITAGVGLADLVRKEKAGIVVQKSIDEVILGIKNMLQDENNRKKIGENAKNAALKYLLQNGVAKKFIEEYNLLINEHARKK